jgi:hypothetical protein
MTIEQLKLALGVQPFQPFTLYLTDGREAVVRHRDFISCAPSGRTTIVHHDDDSYSVIDLLLVTELKFHAPGSSGNGARRPRRR